MDDDLAMRIDAGMRTKALIVCTAFLIPANQKAAAVELTRGCYKEPLEWPVKN